MNPIPFDKRMVKKKKRKEKMKKTSMRTNRTAPIKVLAKKQSKAKMKGAILMRN